MIDVTERLQSAFEETAPPMSNGQWERLHAGIRRRRRTRRVLAATPAAALAAATAVAVAAITASEVSPRLMLAGTVGIPNPAPIAGPWANNNDGYAGRGSYRLIAEGTLAGKEYRVAMASPVGPGWVCWTIAGRLFSTSGGEAWAGCTSIQRDIVTWAPPFRTGASLALGYTSSTASRVQVSLLTGEQIIVPTVTLPGRSERYWAAVANYPDPRVQTVTPLR